MTDERLDQILKQALAPEINDSEIQIRRKVRNKKMSMKKIIAGGFAACAALTLVVAGGCFGGLWRSGGDETASVNEEKNVFSDNFFAITAYAAELPEGVTSGDVIGLSRVETGHGSSSYLDGRLQFPDRILKR